MNEHRYYCRLFIDLFRNANYKDVNTKRPDFVSSSADTLIPLQAMIAKYGIIICESGCLYYALLGSL